MAAKINKLVTAEWNKLGLTKIDGHGERIQIFRVSYVHIFVQAYQFGISCV